MNKIESKLLSVPHEVLGEILSYAAEGSILSTCKAFLDTLIDQRDPQETTGIAEMASFSLCEAYLQNLDDFVKTHSPFPQNQVLTNAIQASTEYQELRKIIQDNGPVKYSSRLKAIIKLANILLGTENQPNRLNLNERKSKSHIAILQSLSGSGIIECCGIHVHINFDSLRKDLQENKSIAKAFASRYPSSLGMISPKAPHYEEMAAICISTDPSQSAHIQKDSRRESIEIKAKQLRQRNLIVCYARDFVIVMFVLGIIYQTVGPSIEPTIHNCVNQQTDLSSHQINLIQKVLQATLFLFIYS